MVGVISPTCSKIKEPKKSGKREAIIPIYKSGDKTVPSNYRPISMTSVICSLRKNY